MIIFVTKDPNRHDVSMDTTLDLFGEVHDYCAAQPELGFDLETTGLSFFRNKPLLTVIGTPDRCYVVDNTEASGWPLNEVLDFPGAKDKLYLGHNLKFDFGFSLYAGAPPFLNCHDTQITEQCLIKGLDVGQGKGKNNVPGLKVNLKDTLQRRTGKTTMEKSVREEFPNMSWRYTTFSDRHIKYAGEDVVDLWEIRDEQLRVAEEMEQTLQVNLNNAVVPCVAMMETAGILMDKEKWLENAKLRVDEVEQAERDMDEYLRGFGVKSKPRVKTRYYQQDLFGGPPVLVVNKNKNHINYNSGTQLKKLFNSLGWEIPTDSKGKETFGKEDIDSFILKNFHSPQKDFLTKLKAHKTALKRMSSFGVTFLEKLNPATGTMHTNYNTNKTATGRFSSSEPNLQQIPNTLDYRHCFIRRPGHKIMTADYSGAELRILASMSGDRKMIDIMANGEDLHSAMATPVWRVIYDDPTLVITEETHKKERTLSKRVTFSKLYGATVNKTALILDVPLDVAQRCEDALREFLPDAFGFLDKQGEFAVEHGYLLFNQVVKSRRYFPEIIQLNKEGMPVFTQGAANIDDWTEGSIGRKAANAPMQGTNGDMMKIAIVNLTHYINKMGYKDRLLMQVHDEIVIEMVDDETVRDRAQKYSDIMDRAANKFLDKLKMKTVWDLEDYWTK